MPENKEKLKTTLNELHAELSGAESLDPELRDLLEATVADINATLQKRTDGDESPPEESITGRLSDAVQQFEDSHPTLAGVVQRMIDVLGQMGI